MILREATERDIPGIARVHVDTSQSTYRGIFPDKIIESLSYQKRERGWHQVFDLARQDGSFTYVAEDRSGQIIGFANAGKERSNDPVYRGELNAIYILKSYQQQGIGSELVRVVADRFSQMEIYSLLVWVLEDNPASNFYQKLGGKKVNQKYIIRGGKELMAIAYGWTDISNLQRIDAN